MMKSIRFFNFCVLVCFGITFSNSFAQATEIKFNRDILPILSENCFQCHGFDPNTREAGLRLDVRESALEVIDGIAAISPGHPEKSYIIEKIFSEDSDDLMPPPESEKKLSASQKELIKSWIEQGAPYEKHWAYIPPSRESVPDSKIFHNPIDRFLDHQIVNSKKEIKGFSRKATSRELVRRLSFDLTGLPPTPGLVERYSNVQDDKSSYQQLVEELLNSPHFGERMAVYWLDLVRWADTMGFHSDDERRSTPYRDYVIDAFNANMPFDRFTREQLAGDLLSSPTQNQLIASGYNRMNQVTGEGGAQPKEYRAKYMADKTRNVSAVWMGATLGCAECHDHKFDPFTAKDFYSMAAFFADLEEPDLVSYGRRSGIFNPAIQIDPNVQVELDKLDKLIAEAKAKKEDIKDLNRKRESIAMSGTWTVVSKQRMKPRVMRILPRGNFLDESGPEVEPAIPAFLGKIQKDARLTRLDLAEWIVSHDNPLTARVFVNRLWYLFYGRGLSSVLDDLGYQGEWPSHPELLDWLAVEFMESGWDIKSMIRLMVSSDSYQQTSNVGLDLVKLDPANSLHARQVSYRIHAEFVRDMALFTSGLLNEQIGGKSAKPYQPDGYWSDSYKSVGNPHKYHRDKDEKLYRRGLYTFWKRTFVHPELLTFDAPNREECVAQRPISNTPLQALLLLNDTTFVESARVLALTILQSGQNSFKQNLEIAFQRVLQRSPRENEIQIISGLYKESLHYFTSNPNELSTFLKVGDASNNNIEAHAQLGAWTQVCRALLNLHESITRP